MKKRQETPLVSVLDDAAFIIRYKADCTISHTAVFDRHDAMIKPLKSSSILLPDTVSSSGFSDDQFALRTCAPLCRRLKHTLAPVSIPDDDLHAFFGFGRTRWLVLKIR